jgi:hypothetical protein
MIDPHTKKVQKIKDELLRIDRAFRSTVSKLRIAASGDAEALKSNLRALKRERKKAQSDFRASGGFLSLA